MELMQTGNKPWCCKPQLLFINVGLSHCIYCIVNVDGVIGSLGQAFQAEVMKRGPKFYIYTWGLKPGEGGGTPKILTQVCTSSLRNRTLRKLTPKSRSSLGQIFEIIPFTRENSSSYSTAKVRNTVILKFMGINSTIFFMEAIYFLQTNLICFLQNWNLKLNFQIIIAEMGSKCLQVIGIRGSILRKGWKCGSNFYIGSKMGVRIAWKYLKRGSGVYSARHQLLPECQGQVKLRYQILTAGQVNSFYWLPSQVASKVTAKPLSSGQSLPTTLT